MTEKPLMRFDASRDELVPVTQEWVDMVQHRIVVFDSMHQELRDTTRRLLLNAVVAEITRVPVPQRPNHEAVMAVIRQNVHEMTASGKLGGSSE